MSNDVKITVDGLSELRKELKSLGNPELLEQLREANVQVAEHVVTAAHQHAFSALTRAAAASLKASRTLNKAQVTGGSARVPFFGGAEFGAQGDLNRVGPSGRHYVGHNQFQPFRGSGAGAGYFLYPAIRAETPEIIEMYGESMERITAAAFPD